MSNTRSKGGGDRKEDVVMGFDEPVTHSVPATLGPLTAAEEARLRREVQRSIAGAYSRYEMAKLLATLDAARAATRVEADLREIGKEAKALIRAAISDAYYEARNDGETMEHAASDAARRVLEVLEGYGIRVATRVEADLRIVEAARDVDALWSAEDGEPIRWEVEAGEALEDLRSAILAATEAPRQPKNYRATVDRLLSKSATQAPEPPDATEDRDEQIALTGGDDPWDETWRATPRPR